MGVGFVEFGMGHRVVAHHRHPRHRLDAGTDEGAPCVHLDGAGGYVDGVHRRSAEPVDGDAGDALRQTRAKDHEPRHVQALLGLREGAAEDQILDIVGIDAGLRDQALDHLGGKLVGPHSFQRAFLGGGERRPGISGDHDILHIRILRCGLMFRRLEPARAPVPIDRRRPRRSGPSWISCRSGSSAGSRGTRSCGASGTAPACP